MRLADAVYFAPGIWFEDVDYNGAALPEQFVRRIEGFYLRPAELLVRHGEAFAAGVILVSAIDALARLRYPLMNVTDRFRRFARHHLASFPSSGLADCPYFDFRNGIVHESRVKAGRQFSLATQQTVAQEAGTIILNPACLLNEVRDALRAYHTLLKSNPAELSQLAASLTADHASDPQRPAS